MIDCKVMIKAPMKDFRLGEPAGNDELIYAYYDEDMNTEFIHVRDSVRVRAYTQFAEKGRIKFH